MDFEFGEDQELLRATLRRFLDERQPLARLRRSLEEPALFDRELWRQGGELGWTAMLVPDEHEGGSITEQPLVDLVVLRRGARADPQPGTAPRPCNVAADAIARFGRPHFASAGWLRW